MLYDIEMLLKDLNLSKKEKEEFLKELRTEFPEDDMLFELHLFRAVQYFKKLKTKNES